MMGKKDNQERNQLEVVSLEDLVPNNHPVRKLDAAMDFHFIYDIVKDLYKPTGRESIDPVVLVKIAFIQYIFGIPSMKRSLTFQPLVRTIQEDFKTATYLSRFLNRF